MYVFVPDAPMPNYGGMMGQPMPPSEDIRIAKEIIKRDKIERKKKKADDAKKEAKSKPRTFTFLETTGMIMLFSIPLAIAQLSALNYVKDYLSALH